MRILFILALLFALPAQAETITITNEACEFARLHQPDASVEFQPGMDADGNAVAPADLDGGGIMPWPQDITIPLALDLQNSLNISNRLTGTDAIIGTVEYKNGKLYFNGQPIGESAQADIIAACRQARMGGAADGDIMQKPANILLGE